VTETHSCPYGLESLDLLKSQGFDVEDHHLKTDAEAEAFKKRHGVDTTPQTFINGVRIGGYDELREHLHPKGPCL
jgi:glutaredoxin